MKQKFYTKKKINKKNTLERIGKILQKMGARNVAITGIETKEGFISDFIQEKIIVILFQGIKFPKLIMEVDVIIRQL